MNEPNAFGGRSYALRTRRDDPAFMADGSDRLRRMRRADLLDAGIRLPDGDGVIPFRPTRFTRRYGRRIGRALRATKGVPPGNGISARRAAHNGDG